MPLLSIETNQSVDTEACQTLLPAASKAVADMLGKPEQFVMVRIHHNPNMYFAGSHDPLALLQLKSLGLPEEKTSTFSETLCQFISEQLDIPVSRIYIEFTNPPRHMWGWQSRTF